jgi:hypothetical protein
MVAGMEFGAYEPIKDTKMNAVVSDDSRQVGHAPFRLRERRLSQPLFLEAIAGLLPSLLPMLAPAIGRLVSGNRPAHAATPGTETTPARDNASIAQLAALAEQVLRALGPTAQRVVGQENLRLLNSLLHAVAGSNASTRTPVVRAQSMYSEAQVAPALLAAIPALMPLLRQILSPQTVQSIIQAPERMTGQIINGITDFARLGLQADQQLQEHLRSLNPGVDDPALHQLLASMSMMSAGGQEYKRVSSVRLQLESVKTQVVMGREQILYRQGRDLHFPLYVETPRVIANAKLLIQLKQADNLRIVHEKTERLQNVGSGPIDITPVISASVSEKLQPQKDYIVILTLLWRNSRGDMRGTSIQQTIGLMGKFRFDRVEESGDLIPLLDREAFGDYWHKIWEDAFDSQTRRFDIRSRYYLLLKPEKDRNDRLDSEVRRKREGARETLRLRSGYNYSLYALNHLLTRLAPDQTPLDADVLRALTGDDFIERFNQAARHQGRFRGRSGQTASLWVFPVFKLQTLVLVRSEDIDANGNIGRLAEKRVSFPMPVMLHFTGVKQP